jgi:hypothetical protein
MNTNLKTQPADVMDQVPVIPKNVVIIPLYGYWADLPVEQLNYQTLQKFLEGFRFADKYVKYIFVGEKERLPKDIMNLFITRFVDGATTFVNVPSFSVYAEYLQAGLKQALDDPSDEIMIFANPWIYLAPDTANQLADRINRSDYGMICGWDKKEDGLTPEAFLQQSPLNSVDRIGVSRDLFGFERIVGGTISFDENYKTPYYVLADFWGQLHTKGQESLRVGNLAYYSFDVDFSLIEPEENFEEDKSYFVKKWGFIPGDITYKSSANNINGTGKI